MSSIWAIEQGSYSDYHVVGVFDSKEAADKFCALLNVDEKYDLGEVVEWPLNPHMDEINAGLQQFQVCMDYNGDIERIKETGVGSYQSELRIWRRTTVPNYRRQKVNDAVHGHVWAKDITHAVKITNEFRAQCIAENKMHAFPTDKELEEVRNATNRQA